MTGQGVQSCACTITSIKILPVQTDIPGGLRDVLWNVRINIPEGIENQEIAFDSDGQYVIAYFPLSSTSAGAVPAFLASSNSFFLRQSSLESFWPDAAADMFSFLVIPVIQNFFHTSDRLRTSFNKVQQSNPTYKLV